MNIYFTVDRSGVLQPGERLERNGDLSGCRIFPIKDCFGRTDIESLARAAFPDGLSRHGKRYFLDESLVVPGPNGPEPYAPHTPILELVTELVRRLEFPDRLSRYQALFAWETREDADSFRTTHCKGQGNILRIKAKCAGRYDMNQLYLGGATSGSWMFARRYWSGVASRSPLWEILLDFPCDVI